MASIPFTAKYAVVSPSGSSSGSTGLLDLDLNFGNVTTVGQNIQYVGSAAVDAVFLRPGVSVNFTASGVGVDKLYLEGDFADYTYKLSGKFVVLTRTVNGLIESATVATGDTLVFADGFMPTEVLIDRLRLKITSSPTLDTSEKSTDPQVQLEGQPSITATALGKTGVTFAQGIQGVALKVVGAAGVDTVYVKAGTEVDASGLGAGQDVIYFTGNYADYTKSVTITKGKAPILVLERTVGSDEVVEKITLATSGDKAVFADGSALTDAIKAKVDANESQATWPADWQPSETTPTAYTDVQAITFDATKSSHVKNGTYKSNDVLVFSVKFKQAVTVGGVPTLALNVGGKTVYAEYDSALTGKSKTDLKFKYTVHSGDVDDNGISVLPSAANTSVINLNGGSINLTSAGSPPAKLVQTPALKDVATAKVDALAPLIQASYSVDENTTTTKALKSIDLKANEGVTWSGLSGPDAKAFTLGSGKNAGKLFFKAAADYESQSAFSVAITGTDVVGNKTTQDLTINLTNVNEAPVVGTPLVNQVFAVGAATNSYTIPSTAFKDVDEGDELTYSAKLANGQEWPTWLAWNSEAGTFAVKPDSLSTITAKTAPVKVRVTATDGDLSAYSDFTISWRDAPMVQSLIVNNGNGSALGKAGDALTLTVTFSQAVTSIQALTAVFNIGGKEVTAKHGAISSATDTLTFTLNVPEGANGTVSLKSLVADNKGKIQSDDGVALLAPAAGAIADAKYVVDTQAPTVISNYSVAENTAADTAFKRITLVANEAVTWSDLSGEDASNFTLGTAGDNVGKLLFNSAANFEAKNNYKVTITGTDAAGNAKSQDITINLTNVNEASIGSVTLGGTPTQGHVLTASHTLADPDGPQSLSVSYKWQVSASGNSGWADISGALGSTFTLTEAQVDKYVRVVASYTDGAGVLETVNSAPTNTAIVNLNDAPIGNLNLTGTPRSGQVLTATQAFTDADGIGSISYQWQTSADGTSNWSDIIDATDSTYTLTRAQSGQFVRVVGHYTDGHGTAETVNSNATSTAVVGPTLTAVIKGFDKYGETVDGVMESSLTDVVGAMMTDLSWGWEGYQNSALLEGTTEAEATVNFTLGGQTRSATADQTGYWNYRLTADDFANVGAGAETITITSIADKNGYTSNTQITRNVTFNAVADTMSHNEDGYGSDYIDALVEGGTGWAGKVITYSFAPGSGLAAWTASEKRHSRKLAMLIPTSVTCSLLRALTAVTVTQPPASQSAKFPTAHGRPSPVGPCLLISIYPQKTSMACTVHSKDDSITNTAHGQTKLKVA
jgi:hypothetical protein